MQTLFKLAAFLPLRLLRAMGLLLGLAAWVFSARYRQAFNTQWHQALSYWSCGRAAGALPAETPRKISAIGQAGVLLTELPKIWCRPEAARAMKSTGFAEIHAALGRGKGLIILTPHLGAFELAARRIALEFPLTVLYRPARKPWVERLLQAFRSAEGVRAVPANAQGVRQLLRALRQGQAIGLLPDQVPSQGEGLVSDFFGRPAYTMTLPIRLAQASGAAVAWATALRIRGGWSLTMELWKAPPQNATADDSAQLAAMPLEEALARMNQGLEARIARAPEQYLWAYNRYKHL
jgi:KDO2-lipid IV(A) lauroyltransferase